MIGPGTGVRVCLACGVTDMRKGIAGLSAMAQDVLRQKPTGGAVFAFRGLPGDRVKLFYWDGQGFCLYYKVLERGRFPWPSAEYKNCSGKGVLSQCRLPLMCPPATAHRVPDAKTVWFYRYALAQVPKVAVLFQLFDGLLNRQGYIARSEQILDAPIVPVPRSIRRSHLLVNCKFYESYIAQTPVIRRYRSFKSDVLELSVKILQ